MLIACGRKGDPIPRARASAEACKVRWTDLRVLEVVLPEKDLGGGTLAGVERVRVYYLPMGHSRPNAFDVLNRGEIVFERRRPDVPSPGKTLRLNLGEVNRPAGWLVVSAVRVGNVVGTPSEVILWLDPAI